MGGDEGGRAQAVTGAFGYSGRHIAGLLLREGRRVVTLTNARPDADPFEGRVPAFPLRFDRPRELVESLRGVSVLYNTYWVRFNHRGFTQEQAVLDTSRLFAAAREAGVERVVHISITNPSETSRLEYFRGKARLEAELVRSGLSYAILRPAVLFGGEDILINNIAWMLRRYPVFAVFGRGDYRLQPIHVDDLARLAVDWGARREDATVEAIGPETFTYRDLVITLGRAIGRPRPIVSVPPLVVHGIGLVLGGLLRDVVITRDEIRGLMEGRLCVDAPPAGSIALSAWAREHAGSLGRRYASELGRRRRPSGARDPA